MVDFSYLYTYNGFSLSKFLFGDDDDDKKKEKKVVKKSETLKNNEKKEESVKKQITVNLLKNNKKNNNNSLTQNQKKLILKLEIAFDNYLYRKKVRNLIELLKDNYMIVCTANIPNLYLNIIRNKKVKQYKLIYEPILKQNVAFLPRKVYRNKKQLKFIFANLKKEIFFEPQYKTEYEDGSFINVLDLQEIKEKEDENEENFNQFLKEYFKKNKKEDKKEDKKKEEKKEDFNSDLKNNKLSIKKKVKSGGNIKVNKKVIKNRTSVSLLKNKDKSLFTVNSILKERSTQRIKNGRKISFGSVQFSY